MRPRRGDRCDVARTRVVTVARDRPRLLATLAGALTVCGLDVIDANLFGTTDGLALDVFRAADPFGRVEDGGEQRRAHDRAARSTGELDVATRVDERRRDYAAPRRDSRARSQCDVVVDESATDTFVEVHADDDVGLLYRLAATFADLEPRRAGRQGRDPRRARRRRVLRARRRRAARSTTPSAIEQLHGALVDRLSQWARVGRA